jgi:hypothetical protein
MSAEQYMEWQEFDLIEPINPAGMILFGLSGKKPGTKSGSSWQAQKAKLLQHAALVKGKKR